MEGTLEYTEGSDRFIQMVKSLYPWLTFHRDYTGLWIEPNRELRVLLLDYILKEKDNEYHKIKTST